MATETSLTLSEIGTFKLIADSPNFTDEEVERIFLDYVHTTNVSDIHEIFAILANKRPELLKRLEAKYPYGVCLN